MNGRQELKIELTIAFPSFDHWLISHCLSWTSNCSYVFFYTIMFLGSIARSVLSKSTKANLVAQIPLKSVKKNQNIIPFVTIKYIIFNYTKNL